MVTIYLSHPVSCLQKYLMSGMLQVCLQDTVRAFIAAERDWTKITSIQRLNTGHSIHLIPLIKHSTKWHKKQIPFVILLSDHSPTVFPFSSPLIIWILPFSSILLFDWSLIFLSCILNSEWIDIGYDRLVGGWGWNIGLTTNVYPVVVRCLGVISTLVLIYLADL